MISAKSLFNKGIYKNALNRFKWGSLIYFVMLFFSGPFVFMIKSAKEFEDIYRASMLNGHFTPVILDINGYLIFPVILAFAVPTIVALLTYNYVHSPRHGIFMHSVPADRKSNYFSSLMAAFTLMLLPLIAISVIYVIMSLCGYGKIIGVSASLIWLAVNAYIIFVMFSVSTFSAFLTGNSFALIAINAIIHLIPVVLAFAVLLLGNMFLYGFCGDYIAVENIMKFSPAVLTVTNLGNCSLINGEFFKTASTWIMLAASAVIYVLAYVLYRKRKIENCGDVAAFAVFKPILKYTVTASACVVCFGILVETEMNAAVRIIAAAIICALVYFAAEMILTKSVRVFGSYKGFAVFALCCTGIACFTAYTSVFGFETYVPSENDVEEAAVYTLYYNSNDSLPYITDSAAVKEAVKQHKKMTTVRPLTNPLINRSNKMELYFAYKLKNGKTVRRMYIADSDFCDSVLSRMFESEEYKMKFTGLSMLNIENLTNVNLEVCGGNFNYSIAMNEDSVPLFRAIEKDVRSISYEEFSQSNPIFYYINIFEEDENSKNNADVFKKAENPQTKNRFFNINLNSGFKNTIKFLKDTGYYNIGKNRFSDNLYISKSALEYNSKETDRDDRLLSRSGMEKIDFDDAAFIYDNYATVSDADHKMDNGKYYMLYSTQDESVWSESYVLKFKENELPEVLKKYVE